MKIGPAKKDPKGFVIQSYNTHLIYNGEIYKIIKYKKFRVNALVFFKRNGKIYQRLSYKFHYGSVREIFNYTLRNNILLYREINKTALRYLRRYYPQDLIIL